ncbi:MAG: peptidoglycan DD-metalloendopeptidase family protein [Pseudomonadota bacterium]
MMRTIALAALSVRCAVLGAALLAAGCATRSPAPVDDRRPVPTAQPGLPVLQPTPVPGATPPAAAAPSMYIVKRSDTLYSIALEHGVDYRDLSQWNRLEDPTRLRIGQELRVTSPEDRSPVQVGVARVPREVESRPLGSSSPGSAPPAADGGMKTSPKALRLPYSEQNLAALSRGDVRAETKPEARPEARPETVKPAPAPERDPEAIEFAWPARGRVMQAFSEPNNKGLDIAGKPGDPVLAAASGRVMYTGTGIRGYGKLIVIKHDNNFNSVYAHNREILVKEGQNVTRGQRIAELGDTDADTPKLHFEIRKSGKPVDPARYLPPS